MSIDILFIHPGNHKKTYQNLSKEFTAIATPVWATLLAHYIRKKGFSTAIYDVNVQGWDEDSAKELISRYKINLIVMMVYGHNPSASTQTMPAAGRIAKDIKRYNRDIPIAMGGTHPSALPVRTLNEEEVDYIIQGEGAKTIEGLILYIKGKKEISKVKGLWFIDKNKDIHFTGPSLLIKNLDDDFDSFAWDLLPTLSNYRAHNMHCFQDFHRSKMEDFSDVRSPYAVIYTSLGCPYSCHYCCINAVYGKQGIRYWSLEKVISWIDLLVGRYGVKNIRFDDELFILSPKRVETFCDMLIERGYNLNLWVYGRVDTVAFEDSLIGKLKKAGVNWICLGIESASERVRLDVNKNVKGDIKDIVRKLQANGIYVLGNYMFGLPEDSLETMEATLNQAIDLNCEFVNFYTVMAYPGSKLYENALLSGSLLPENWEGFSQHGFLTQPLPTRYLTSQEVLRFRDYAFYTYYNNPSYLEKIEAIFGEKVKKHIGKMVSMKIRRRLLEEEVYV